MEHEHSVAESGALWARVHQQAADRIRDEVTGTFAFKKCHQPDDMLCPNCFRELVRLVHEEDPSVADSMRKGGYVWTRAWLRGVLR